MPFPGRFQNVPGINSFPRGFPLSCQHLLWFMGHSASRLSKNLSQPKEGLIPFLTTSPMPPPGHKSQPPRMIPHPLAFERVAHLWITIVLYIIVLMGCCPFPCHPTTVLKNGLFVDNPKDYLREANTTCSGQSPFLIAWYREISMGIRSRLTLTDSTFLTIGSTRSITIAAAANWLVWEGETVSM